MLICYLKAYHSAFNEDPDIRQVGNMAVLPIKTKFRGPAPLGMHTLLLAFDGCTELACFPADYTQADIIDETLDLFRANSLFRNFEIKGPADRLLIVLILFVSDCLAKIGSARTVPNQLEANKTLNTLAVDNFPIPGDANFPLNAHYAPPASRADAGAISTSLLLKCCAEMHGTTCRLSTAVPHSGTAGTCCSSRREAVRRRHGQTKQVVDVLPEEAFHEQERSLRDGRSCTHIQRCNLYQLWILQPATDTTKSPIPKHCLFLAHFFLLLSLGFFLPKPITGMSPSNPRLLTLLPFPPAPALTISGTQSGSIQLPSTAPPAPVSPRLAAPSKRRSSRSLFPSARFFARCHASWSSRRMRPSPGPPFALPGFGAGIA